MYICMKIFYTPSYYGKSKYQRYYDMVCKAIIDTNVELISPEKGNYLRFVSAKERRLLKTDRKIHYEAIRKGILWADAVIIEISKEDFQLGHEATLTIQNKKHVLCLSIHENFGEKIINSYFHGAKYNAYNIEEIVSNFIERVQKEQLSERFNLFLTPRQLHDVGIAAEKLGVNKSEYIRGLIEKNCS